MILGIISLAAIAVALMPSPGNFWHPPTENQSIGRPEAIETAVQMPAQGESTPFVVTGLANQTSNPPVTQPPIETVPKPVYTNVTVVPENVVVTTDQKFKMEIWINNVTDMAGWEVRLLWNKEIIKCVEAHVNTPPEWGGMAFDWFNKTEADVQPNDVYVAWQFGPGIENEYNDTYGQYFKAECFGPRGGNYHNTFNGSIAVVTLTFQPLQTGSTTLSLWKNDYVDAEGIKISDRKANPIPHITYNGFVEVQSPALAPVVQETSRTFPPR